VELHEPFGLPAVLGAVTSTAQDQNHRMLSLRFRELPAFRGMVGQLIVGEDGPRNIGFLMVARVFTLRMGLIPPAPTRSSSARR
jgi:hypothetical protein